MTHRPQGISRTAASAMVDDAVLSASTTLRAANSVTRSNVCPRAIIIASGLSVAPTAATSAWPKTYRVRVWA